MISQFFSQNHGFFAFESHKKKPKKVKMPNKIFDANHSEKKPDFSNLASKKPNWQPWLHIAQIFKSQLIKWKSTDLMLVKSWKNCKSCNVVFVFFYLIKTCFVYCICVTTSSRICGSLAVLNFHMWLFLKKLCPALAYALLASVAVQRI